MRREVRDWLKRHEAPAILLIEGKPDSGSWLGGNPVVPEGFRWPRYRDQFIPFLGQLRMADLPILEGLPNLPRDGYLYFFFMTEGGIPEIEGHERGFEVVYLAEESCLSEASFPGPIPAPQPVKGWRKLLGLKPKWVERTSYHRKPIAFKPIVTNSDSTPDDLLNTDDEIEFENLLSGAFGDAPKHHLFGYPQPVQSSSDEMLQAISELPIATAGERWQLLLQIDEDAATGFDWIDAGRIYFWIPEQDLAIARFDRVLALIEFC